MTLVASVDPTEAGNAKSRIALGVSDRAVHQRAAVTSTTICMAEHSCSLFPIFDFLSSRGRAQGPQGFQADAVAHMPNRAISEGEVSNIAAWPPETARETIETQGGITPVSRLRPRTKVGTNLSGPVAATTPAIGIA